MCLCTTWQKILLVTASHLLILLLKKNRKYPLICTHKQIYRKYPFLFNFSIFHWSLPEVLPSRMVETSNNPLLKLGGSRAGLLFTAGASDPGITEKSSEELESDQQASG